MAPAYGSKTDSNGSNETILIGYDGTVGSTPPASTTNVPGEGDEDDEGGDE